jgi:thymidylate synthase
MMFSLFTGKSRFMCNICSKTTFLKKHYSTYNHQEKQYLKLIETILNTGEKRYTRNGYTYSIFGHQMRYSLKNNTIPILTTKKVAWKTCLKELLWFLNGDTNNETLKKQNVNIWNENGTREFLDSRGLHHYSVDELGPIYGHQWRRFNETYIPQGDCSTIQATNTPTTSCTNGIDQIQYIIDCLSGKNSEGQSSRRLLVSAWNPCQLREMALPPCHVLFQFYVNTNEELSCHLYQRSGDVGLGIPFNIASYGFLTHLLAKHCGLRPGEFIHSIGDAHIYEEHIDALKKQVTRAPYPFPKLYIQTRRDKIENYKMVDFQVVDYKYNGVIKMDMKA